MENKKYLKKKKEERNEFLIENEKNKVKRIIK